MSECIEVCAACLRACCWQGFFMCDDARTASTVIKSRDELVPLGLEHPSYWQPLPAPPEERT